MVKVSGFNILWAHEAEDWIQYHKELGGGWEEEKQICVPNEEEKIDLETELYTLSDIVKKFAREMIDLMKDEKYESWMTIWFNVSRDFNIKFWYEPEDKATHFIIRDDKFRTTARIIFKDIPSIDFTSSSF
ncbi:hypothetical protein GH157_01730 [archaeon]|nr:hypothetical protein [archaeon]